MNPFDPNASPAAPRPTVPIHTFYRFLHNKKKSRSKIETLYKTSTRKSNKFGISAVGKCNLFLEPTRIRAWSAKVRSELSCKMTTMLRSGFRTANFQSEARGLDTPPNS